MPFTAILEFFNTETAAIKHFHSFGEAYAWKHEHEFFGYNGHKVTNAIIFNNQTNKILW